MAELLAKTACAGLLPLTVGGLSLSESAPAALTTLAPYRGQEQALSKALMAAHGLGFPAIHASTQGKKDARAIWFGRDLALLIGPEPDSRLAQHAALSDQSQGWAVVELAGVGAAEVLARLCPVDLRAAAFPVGASLRTEAKHMMVSISRLGEDRFQIMVFRSMARTLIHDLKTAMEAGAARG
ncbi:sarcosine oxidase subunit gamma [Pseudophaeobacter leonis]|uniref:sarcosine oxidase subunit gamma n=1 Tax=Pseudophaeobacter leonis TaxID=1144477 RepID=UPI0009F6D95D|nr:sarcosine oxidase subunit gamma family protein [Pseudophaeobacter leonis]